MIKFLKIGAVVIVLGGLIGFLYLDHYNREQEKAQQEARRLEEIQRKKDVFNNRRDQIIAGVKRRISAKDYKGAVSLSNSYLVSGDEELKELNRKAKNLFELAEDEEKREKRTEHILSILKEGGPIAVIDRHERVIYRNWDKSILDQPLFVERNKDLYQELVDLNPNNKEYREMRSQFLQDLNDHREEKRIKRKIYEEEQAKRIAKFGNPPDVSIWGKHGYDGPVMKYLKDRAHDPSSISISNCSDLGYSQDGWIIKCEYRGINAFGAIVRQTNWFTIVDNKVINVEDSRVYQKGH